jgi:hypothetical protein
VDKVTTAPVLETVKVRITTPTTLHVETARYLCYRAAELWPLATAMDTAGEQYTHRSHWIPKRFMLLESPAGGASIEVVIYGAMIELALAHVPTDARAQMEHLADDPIWGPQWLLPVTRYFA